MYGMFQTPQPKNETVLDYAPGSVERLELKAALSELSADQVEIPLIIGGKRITTGRLGSCILPHNHKHQIGVYHMAGPNEIKTAIEAALKAQKTWVSMHFEERAAVMLRAADLLCGRYRSKINAAAMLSLSKTPHQSEIDAVCELADFLRFNVQFMNKIYQDQPISGAGQWNRTEWRPLEGFVFAVTPFNFLSIAGNLPTAPALMGNVVFWKPASSAVYAANWIMKLLEEAGMPPGVINMVPGIGREIGDVVLKNQELAGVHFTGSTGTLRAMWKTIAKEIEPMHYWPRIVGETGGKDFIFAHSSTRIDTLVTAVLRGAFEYQGQKCSAVSRCYIPESIWPNFIEQLKAQTQKIKMGDISDFSCFMGAVIDQKAFDKLSRVLDEIKQSANCEILQGGNVDDSVGYFVEPTIVKTDDPYHKTMSEEFFGPIVTCYVYPDDKFLETMEVCAKTSAYALTGAVFGRDREAIIKACTKLRNAAGNFYINDKPTGAVVGQQPFGGSRASGTNDKAGSPLNLLRWVSPRTIKETFVPPKDWQYPYMSQGE